MKIQKKVLDFLVKNRISVLATILKDKTPYSATMHFALSQKPYFVFFTEKDSKKCSHFKPGRIYPASVVIGFSETDFVEFQSTGTVKIVSNEKELSDVWEVYLKKFPRARKWRDSKTDVMLKFVPKWWRYTEFKPEKKVYLSK